MDILYKILKNKADYNELIDKRMGEINLPERKKTMSTKRFMKEEKRLNMYGSKLRKTAGILAKGEYVLCNECGKFFTFSYDLHKCQPNIKDCQKHYGMEPTEIKKNDD